MPVTKENKNKKANVTIKDVQRVVASEALECYGVVGLASKQGLVGKIRSVISKHDYEEAVFAFLDRNNVSVSVYVDVSKGVKITEVLNEVQKRVRYVLTKTLHLKVKKVDVYAVNVRKID